MEQNTTNEYGDALSDAQRAENPAREPVHTNGNSEPRDVPQNTSKNKDSPQFVDEGIGEDLQEVAPGPALQTTCGCTFSSADHRNHLEHIAIFPEQLQKALKSMSPSQQQYDRVCVVTVCWQASDTPELKKDAENLQNVLKNGYGYDVHPYMLENQKNRIQKIRLDLMAKLMEVRKEVDDPDKNNLFILHYAGHGGRSKDELEYFWQPDASTQAKDALKWTDFEAIIENFECDVLLLLDCCFAGGMLSHENNWLRRVEIIGAAGPDDSAVFKHRVKSTKKDAVAAKSYTLTSAFAAELERRKVDSGTDVSYIINYMQGKEASQKYHLTPSPTYRRNYPDSEMPRSSSIFLKSKLQASTGKYRFHLHVTFASAEESRLMLYVSSGVNLIPLPVVRNAVESKNSAVRLRCAISNGTRAVPGASMALTCSNTFHALSFEPLHHSAVAPALPTPAALASTISCTLSSLVRSIAKARFSALYVFVISQRSLPFASGFVAMIRCALSFIHLHMALIGNAWASVTGPSVTSIAPSPVLAW